MADRNITKRLHRVSRAATFALAVISLSAAAVRPAHAAEDGKTRVNVGVTELTDERRTEEQLRKSIPARIRKHTRRDTMRTIEETTLLC